MLEFQSAFMKSKGQPILYNGKTLMLADKITVPTKFKLMLCLIAVDSDWEQGIAIKVAKKQGEIFSCLSQQKNHYIHIWQDAFSEHKELQYNVTAKKNQLSVWNIWNCGNGVTDAWVMGAAIIKEVISENHFRYYCNDGHPNDDFSDIIFDLKILEAE